MDHDEDGKSTGMSAPRSGAPAVLRALALITPVRDQELRNALLVTVQSFLILAAYSCIKPVRSLDPGAAFWAGIQDLHRRRDWSMRRATGTGVRESGDLVAACPVDHPHHAVLRLARTRVSRARHGVGADCLARHHVLHLDQHLQHDDRGAVLVIAADLYDEEEGKRLFPLFALGASLGAVAGSSLAGLLIVRLGTMAMLPLSAVLLLAAALVVRIIHGSHERGAARATRVVQKPVTHNAQAFRFVIHDRYLLLIGVFSVLFTLVKPTANTFWRVS